MIKNTDNDKIVALRPNDVWMMDVMELRPYQSSNDDNRYIFSVIDVFSRKLWSFPLHTLYQSESIDACRNLKNELEVHPKRLNTDSGPTFGNDFKQYVE